MKDVVAGIIRNEDGLILIAKRKIVQNNGGLWEFPGGKVEENEKYEDALVREIKEEFNMDIVVDSYLGESIYDYGDRVIRLLGFNCTKAGDNFEDLEHDGFKWVTISELSNYEFAKNDIFFVNKLQNDIVERVRDEIINRSVNFYKLTKGTTEEYNLYQEHVKYVYKYVCMLANKYNYIDNEVLKLSALLHDVAMTDINLGREDHNIKGLPLVDEILSKYNYPQDRIDYVKMCVLNHSNSRKDYRTTIEEAVLVDADCLSHFDNIDNLKLFANKVLGLSNEDSIKYVQKKLTKDFYEINPELRYLIEDKYNSIMNES